MSPVVCRCRGEAFPVRETGRRPFPIACCRAPITRGVPASRTRRISRMHPGHSRKRPRSRQVSGHPRRTGGSGLRRRTAPDARSDARQALRAGILAAHAMLGPMASTGWDSGTPDPSLRPCSCGSARATPAGEDALAGPCPAQASSRVSSPLRKRWTRTPPVAAALGRILAERRHLRRSRCGARARRRRCRRW